MVKIAVSKLIYILTREKKGSVFLVIGFIFNKRLCILAFKNYRSFKRKYRLLVLPLSFFLSEVVHSTQGSMNVR